MGCAGDAIREVLELAVSTLRSRDVVVQTQSRIARVQTYRWSRGAGESSRIRRDEDEDLFCLPHRRLGQRQ